MLVFSKSQLGLCRFFSSLQFKRARFKGELVTAGFEGHVACHGELAEMGAEGGLWRGAKAVAEVFEGREREVELVRVVLREELDLELLPTRPTTRQV